MKKIFKIILTFIKVRYFSKWTSRDKLLEYQEKQVEKHLKFLKKAMTITKNVLKYYLTLPCLKFGWS